MPQLDDIVQRIILEGGDQITSVFDTIAEKGKEAFDALQSSFSSGGRPLEGIATAAVALEGAFASAAAALLAFANSTDTTIVRMNAMATSFGVTGSQLTELQDHFAAAGIGTQQFGRLVQRTATTIATSWTDILDNVRNSATQQIAATVAIQQADLKVEEAQNALANGSRDRAAQMAADNLAVETSVLKLGQVYHDVMTQTRLDILTTSGATLSLTNAQNALDTLLGHPPTAEEQQQLKIDEARLAVQKAEQAQQDAINTQLQNTLEQQSKLEAARQAAADAARKRDEDFQKGLIEERQQVVALTEAENHAADVRIKAHELELQDLQKISAALKTVAQGGIPGLDLAEVTVTNIVKALQLLSSESGKAPTGFDVLKNLADVFHGDTGKIISDSQRIAIAAQFAGGSMRSLVGPQFVQLMAKGSGALTEFSDKAQKMGVDIQAIAPGAERFRSAMASLGTTLDLVKLKFASLINDKLTSFLQAIEQSFSSLDGVGHNFVTGIELIGRAIGLVIDLFENFAALIDHVFNLQPGTAFKLLLLTIAGIIALFAAPLIAWPVLIGLVVIAVGMLGDAWTKVKQTVFDAIQPWAQFASDTEQEIEQSVADLAANIKAIWDGIAAWIRQKFDDIGTWGHTVWDSLTKAADDAAVRVKQTFDDLWSWIKSLPLLNFFFGTSSPGGTAVVGAAGGGHIRGPGTETSDSIPIWASVNEFMMRAAAVRKYGLNFMHAINSLQFDPGLIGMAVGGLVSFNAPTPRLGYAAGGAIAGGSRNILNLTIGQDTFLGLAAGDATMKQLTQFAVRQQVSSAGRKPRWHT